jgi:hypothetical protein
MSIGGGAGGAAEAIAQMNINNASRIDNKRLRIYGVQPYELIRHKSMKCGN